MEFWNAIAVVLVLALLLMAGGLFAIASAIVEWTKAWKEIDDD